MTTRHGAITAVTICGAPLSVGLAALYLLRRRPGLAIHTQVDPGRAWLAEGEVVLLGNIGTSWRNTLAPLVACEWPGFLVLDDEARSEHPAAPVGLVDPVQCEVELAEFEPWLLHEPAIGAATLRVPPLGEPLRPSRVLEASFSEKLDLPVLYEATNAAEEFAQYLPLGGGSTMVRGFSRDPARDPVEAIFGAQYALMEVLAAFDR